ncbi:TnpV protein [Campylobacter hyointestinalis]|uniref:TnpV protein n=1 Tax=Campylobacter hyointestinalis TaxID=198 RepID=UPI00241331F8|nr:TnpV protein [Campylobacter hyointestinalis]
MNEMKLEYRKCEDYLLPGIKLSHEEHIGLDKYGRLRREYLQKNAPILYNDLALTERLFPHLWEIEETAQKRLDLIMADLLLQNPAPNKVTDQMGWVRHMNTIKSQAEEVIFAELIYC